LCDKEGANQDWNRLIELGGIDMTEYMVQMAVFKGYKEMMAILKK